MRNKATKTLKSLFDDNGKSVVLEVTRITTLDEAANAIANGIGITLANPTTNILPNVQWAHQMRIDFGGKRL